MEIAILGELTIIIGVSVVTIALLQKLRVPTIAGFIIAGVLVGPHTFGIVRNTANIEAMAEIGVILLLFGIGLELSLDRIRRLLLPILLGGGLQVGVSIGAAFLAARLLGYSPQTSIFIGFIFAVSSTAIVLRAMQDRGEIDAPHGRLTLGILLFQDMCVVPFIMAVPLLAGQGGAEGWESIGTTLGISALVIAGVVIAGRIVVPRFMEWIASTQQKELFLMTVFLVCIVTAWAISLAGVKLALGAFLAGVVVAGSRFSHQALADIVPFRSIFTSIFFVSIGMLLDLGELLTDAATVGLLVVVILLGKFLIILPVGLAMRLPLNYTIITAASLSQVGEFSFILIQAAGGTGLLPAELASAFMAAIVITMLITPLAIAAGPKIVTGATRLGLLAPFLRVPVCCDAEEQGFERHVVIAGYGHTGEKVANTLRFLGIPYVIADLNPQNVRRGAAKGEPIYLGDATSGEILGHLGIERATEFVIAINDPAALKRAIRAARRSAPGVPIIAKVNYLAEHGAAIAAGADEVIVAETAAASKLNEVILDRLDADGGLGNGREA